MSNYDDRNQKNEMKFTKPNTVTTDNKNHCLELQEDGCGQQQKL